MPRSRRNRPPVTTVQVVTRQPIVTEPTSTPAAPNRRRQGPQPQKKKRRNRSRQTSGASYVAALRRPFDVEPRPLGFGTAVPTNVQTLYLRWKGKIANTNFVYCVRPQLYMGMLTYASALGNTVMSASANSSFMDWTNLASFQPSMAGRVVSAGLRATASVAGTSLKGTLGAFFVNSDSLSNLWNKTFDQALALPYCKWAGETGAPVSVLQTTYRPLDPSSFEFHSFPILPGAGVPAGSYQPLLVVIGTGWPVETLLEIHAIANLETLSGLMSVDEDNQSYRLADSPDDALRKARGALFPTVDLGDLASKAEIGMSYASRVIASASGLYKVASAAGMLGASDPKVFSAALPPLPPSSDDDDDGGDEGGGDQPPRIPPSPFDPFQPHPLPRTGGPSAQRPAAEDSKTQVSYSGMRAQPRPSPRSTGADSGR